MKAQASLELIVYFTVVLIILSFITVVTLGNTQNIYTESINADARRVVTLVANEINIAVSVGSGYTHKFSLPAQLYGKDYNVSIIPDKQSVVVVWENRSYSLPILTSNVEGNVKQGVNTVKNDNGLVRIV